MERRLEIAHQLARVKAEIDLATHFPAPQLIVVTKTFPLSDVEILYELGQRDFGENRDQEGSLKSQGVPEDSIWHFQGAIQSNKIKSIVKWSDYIHSLDDLGHARKISEVALGLSKRQKCFIQINLDAPQIPSSGSEGARSGIKQSELESFATELKKLAGIEVVGVMGVGPLGKDPAPAFALLKTLSIKLQGVIPGAEFISAGMSGDYKIALQHGATHIRLGSSILGSR